MAVTSDWNFEKHDIGLVNQAGYVIGLMLVKDKNGAPVYLTSDDDYIADPVRGQSNPNKELPPYVENDFRGGFGLKIADIYSPKRYHYGTNIDARFRNEVRCGPLATTITKPTPNTLTLTDGGLEVWTDANTLTNWTISTGDIDRESTVIHGGTYSMYNTIQAVIDVYQDIEGAHLTEYKGKYITFKMWTNADEANRVLISISDGAGQTDSPYHTGGGDWEELEVSHLVASGATRIRLHMEKNQTSTAGKKFYWDDGTMVDATVGTILCQVDFNNVRYASYGNILMKLNGTGDAYTAVQYFPATITNLLSNAVSGTDYLFICLGWSDAYWYMITDETVTQSTLTGNTLKHISIIGTTFWGSDTNSTIKYTANPINGGTNWTTGKQVGDDVHDIVGLVEFEGLLHIKKEDKPYYKDSSGDIQVLTNETEHLGGTNDQPPYVWHGYLFMPYGEQGLLTYDGTTLSWISPSLYSTGAGDFVGEVRALAGDDQWLYVVLDDGADVQLMAVRNEVVDGTADWRWHPLAELTIAGCASVGITSIYKKRLYIGSTSSANNYTWYPVTTKYGSIDDDTDYKYQTDGYLYTSWLDCGYDDTKAFIKQILTMSHTYDALIYFIGSYRLWGATSWSSVGNFKGSSGVRTATNYIDVANEPASTFIQFRIQFKTDDTSKTAILNKSDLRAILYPSRRNLIYCLVKSVDGLLCKDGSELISNAQVIRTTLNYAKNTEAYPIGFRDINGDTKYVRFLSVDPYSRVTKSEAGRNPEEEYRLVLQEVTLS